MSSNSSTVTTNVDTSVDQGFEGYMTFRPIASNGLIFLWIIITILFPYTWRGALTRSTYKCPSVIMAGIFVFVILPVFNIGAQSLPADHANPTTAKFMGEIAASGFPQFVAFHVIMSLLRIKHTIARWQALIICEIGKTIFLVFMFWGFGRVEWNIPASSIICMVIFAITLVSFTCVRIYYYAIKCNFNRDAFEHLYFGSDSKCPVNRVYLMCLTCDKPTLASAESSQLESDKPPPLKMDQF
jgi:hypothetical protein